MFKILLHQVPPLSDMFILDRPIHSYPARNNNNHHLNNQTLLSTAGSIYQAYRPWHMEPATRCSQVTLFSLFIQESRKKHILRRYDDSERKWNIICIPPPPHPLSLSLSFNLCFSIFSSLLIPSSLPLNLYFSHVHPSFLFISSAQLHESLFIALYNISSFHLIVYLFSLSSQHHFFSETLSSITDYHSFKLSLCANLSSWLSYVSITM